MYADPLAVQHVHMTPSLLQYSAKLAVGSMWAAGVHVNASTAANGSHGRYSMPRDAKHLLLTLMAALIKRSWDCSVLG